MIINMKSLINEIIQKDINLDNTNINPIVRQDLLKESIEEEKEKLLQERVKTIFKDPEYYRPFQEAALPLSSAQPQPEVPVDPQSTAKAKLIQNQLTNVQRQQETQTLSPAKQKSLEEKKIELEAALEKLRIDSEERIANKQIDVSDKNVIKKTVAGGFSAGLGGSVLPTAVGAASLLASKVPWGKVGTGLATAGKWAARGVGKMF